ncbi:gluconokinase [Hoeflea sp.]|uniref:gluconokinase n=1 Tax=Hoeflea sp. TaxID=1940281 RepID=UPI00374854B8
MIGRFVLMGVSGCGKSSVGLELARVCGIEFIDGDDLHPRANIEKMARGEPLDDADRAPWLADVGQALARSTSSTAIGCSALKKTYRDLIRAQVTGPLHFLHLHAAREVLEARVAVREGHFMPPSLLDSQFAALEQLDRDELGREIDISRPLNDVVAQAEAYVREMMK